MVPGFAHPDPPVAVLAAAPSRPGAALSLAGRSPGRPDDVHDLSDRLAALLNAAYIIRLATPEIDPVVAAAVQTIEHQVRHLYRWVEALSEE